MNEDNSPSASEGKKEKSEGPSRKSFLGRIGQIFQGEPKDRHELVEVFRDSEENDLIDHDTRDMLEGVIEISEMRVRDIMLPRSQMVTHRSVYEEKENQARNGMEKSNESGKRSSPAQVKVEAEDGEYFCDSCTL